MSAVDKPKFEQFQSKDYKKISQNGKDETSDGASDVSFDSLKGCLQKITLKKNEVLRTSIDLL